MNDKERNYGLIYFPLSLVILLFLVETKVIPEWAAGMGVLVMGYGDGLAAIFGRKFGQRGVSPIIGKKTFVGSFVMFFTTLIVLSLFALGYNLHWLESARGIALMISLALFAAVCELLTPLGLDNVSVPITTALLAGCIGNRAP